MAGEEVANDVTPDSDIDSTNWLDRALAKSSDDLMARFGRQADRTECPLPTRCGHSGTSPAALRPRSTRLVSSGPVGSNKLVVKNRNVI